MDFLNFIKKAIGRVVLIDNSSLNDNLITNKSDAQVCVACYEPGAGSFSHVLCPGESWRVTYDIKAYALPVDEYYSIDDMKYELGKGEQWEVHRKKGVLVMRRIDSSKQQ